MLLESRDIYKAYGGTIALAGVTLSFPEQGIIAIVGKNGAGKTTLIDSLTGVVTPDRGDWLLSGKVVTGRSTYEIARCGIARSFQGIRLIQEATVMENLSLAVPSRYTDRLIFALLPAWSRRDEQHVRGKAMQLLQEARLQELADVAVGELSYGEQKALSVLVAVATQAQILLLDEPFAGVDAQWTDRMIEIMVGLRAKGKLLVLVDHDLAALRRVADVLVVMQQGRVLASGAPADVLSRPDVVEAYLG
jgi:ABC-type branched-subunit amino acid transport system ATPase component